MLYEKGCEKSVKTPDEIKRGLECCHITECGNCPYMTENIECREIFSDALAYIQQLESKHDKVFRLCGDLHHDMLEQQERADKLEAQRDAAVATIYEMAECFANECDDAICEWCDQTECENLCMMHLSERPGFKWRGVQKEV